MTKINLCVVGAAGRLGLCVLKMLAKPAHVEQFNLVAAIVSMQSPLKDKSVATETGLDTPLLFSGNLSRYLDQSSLIDVIIDCSLPESSMNTVELAKLANQKVVLCATGFSSEQLNNITKAAQALPIVVAPNASTGMNLMQIMSKWMAEKVPVETDIQILETHHIHKKDSPSGAARQLANSIHQRGELRRLGYPNITSMRQGETVGEHTLFFNFEGEQIQLTHKAFDRSIFALGALSAATWLDQVTEPGFYTMEDVLRLNAK